MLSKILSKQECAKCKFCCSFRRQSLWETPVFEWREKMDLLPFYKTQNPDEEVPCIYLEGKKGCTLSPEKKPFDCKIWPLRVVKSSNINKLKIVLEPTCPALQKISIDTIKDFVKSELEETILQYALSHPEIVKEDSDFFIKLD